MLSPELLGVTKDRNHGCVIRREYYRGHPHELGGLFLVFGKPHQGWTGPETIMARTGVSPIAVFEVNPSGK